MSGPLIALKWGFVSERCGFMRDSRFDSVSAFHLVLKSLMRVEFAFSKSRIGILLGEPRLGLQEIHALLGERFLFRAVTASERRESQRDPKPERPERPTVCECHARITKDASRSDTPVARERILRGRAGQRTLSAMARAAPRPMLSSWTTSLERNA